MHELIKACLKIIYNQEIPMLATYDEVVNMSNKRNFDTLRYATRLAGFTMLGVLIKLH